MTNSKTTQRALLTSALSLVLCFAMLLGTTFAWFTDNATSTNNKIQAGSLKIDLELLDKETGWASIKESKAPIFNYNNWEPGYTDVKILKVENEGTLALKWMAKFVSADALTSLANVIDVYVLPSDIELAYPADRSLAGYTKVGTVAEFVNTIEDTTNGTLLANQAAYLGIALKMQESAGNEYQNAEIKPFDIQIVAAQQNYEEDSFDSTYDQFAEFEGSQPQTPTFSVFSAAELQTAMTPSVSNDKLVVNLEKDIELAAGETWVSLNLEAYGGKTRNVVINGNGHTIKGLNAPLLGISYFGNTSVEINDLTLSDVNITNVSGDYAGAFTAYNDNCAFVKLSNCHLTDSVIAVSTKYAGGLIGYCSSPVTVENCSVTNTKISGTGSVGAITGMTSVGGKDTPAVFSNITVTGNTLVSSSTSSYRIGELIGTTNRPNVELSNITTSSNSCTQSGRSGFDSGSVATNWIGRKTSASTVTGDTSAKIN